MGMAGLYRSHVASDLELSRYISPDDPFLPPPPCHTWALNLKPSVKDKGILCEIASSKTIISVRKDQYWETNKETKTSNGPIKQEAPTIIYHRRRDPTRAKVCAAFLRVNLGWRTLSPFSESLCKTLSLLFEQPFTPSYGLRHKIWRDAGMKPNMFAKSLDPNLSLQSHTSRTELVMWKTKKRGKKKKKHGPGSNLGATQNSVYSKSV